MQNENLPVLFDGMKDDNTLFSFWLAACASGYCHGHQCDNEQELRYSFAHLTDSFAKHVETSRLADVLERRDVPRSSARNSANKLAG